jgi:hypothetical protein
MASLRPIRDFERLQKLLEELAKLKAKEKIARDNGATNAQRAQIAQEIGKVRAAIAVAAVAAVAREARAAQDEARRLREGRPERPKPNGGPGDPEPGGQGKPPGGGPPGPGGGGGAGGGGGGGAGGGGVGDFSFGIQPGPPPQPGSQKIPAADLIYVRSDHSVWVWNRYDQTWAQHSFASTILSVEPISGGLLVVAEHSAAIFDIALAEWLRELDTPELLQGGPHGGGVTGPTIVSGSSANPVSPSAMPVAQPVPTPSDPIVAPPPSDDPPISVPVDWQPNPSAPPNPEFNPGLVIDPEPPENFPPPPDPV